MSEIDQLSKEEMDRRVHAILTTDGYDGFVRGLFNRSGDLSKDFTHAVLGLRTECYELLQARDGVNAIEEGGDLRFYLEALHQVVADCDWIVVYEPTDAQMREHASVKFSVCHTAQETMEFCLNQLEDLAKRWVGYRKAPHGPGYEILLYAAGAVRSAMQVSVLRFTPAVLAEETMIRANVAKLLKRYKGTAFNAEHAVNRDVAAERVVLEDAAQV